MGRSHCATSAETISKRDPRGSIQGSRYVYGGAIIQDRDYYPFGNRFFSDLAHYVRSGDFVLALIEESRNLNEYAFAPGGSGALR